MTATTLQQLLPEVLAIARRAGAQIMAVYAMAIVVEAKADDSPLTQADRLSHRSIVDALQALGLGYPILSEEGGLPPYHERQGWTRYWLLDPLDGTREFIQRNGEFTVNIALIEQGVPVLGVVYVPATDVSYYAARGMGAYRCAADGPAEALQVRPHHPGEAWRVVASRSHRDAATEQLIRGLGEVELLQMGSSLKLCLVAEGAAHLYPRLAPTSEWDTAAAQCVLEQAGGEVLGLDLQPLRYNRKASLLNPAFIACSEVSEAWTSLLPADTAAPGR